MEGMSTPASSSWEVAQVLAEPNRRMVFDAVRQARSPMTRDEVAKATGLNRRLTTFHLDRLAEAGLLDTDYARPPGRLGGPGAGRPSKRYVAATLQLDLSVPPRHYDFAARLLAQAIDAAPADAAAAARSVAHEEGRRAGALRRPSGSRAGARQVRAAALGALVDLGYEPGEETAQRVRLRNCPFHAVADVAPDLVCGMNHQLVCGLLEGLGLDPARAALSPDPPNCCVTVAIPRG